jgi:protein-disulfide isomerase
MEHQGQPMFWDYHDWVYQNQASITLENFDTKLQGFSAGHNIDVAKLATCLADKSAQAEVDNSMAIGHHLSVSATPTLFINGRKLEGALEWDTLSQLLQFEIEAAGRR